nr:hypothetical protein [Tanacetum cinerariifolium]
MHNNIMAAGSRDRPPMLATRRYAQWKSRFLGYINTRPNGDALRKCILEDPYQPTIVTIPAVPVIADSQAVPKRTTTKTIVTMSPKNKAYYESKKEAIHLLLTRIRDEIYSNVDACKTAHKIWIDIERLQQESMESYYSRFYKTINEMIRNNLTVAMIQVNVKFFQQLQPEWSRFVTIVKQQHDLDTVSYHKLFDILKQYQKEVNEIRAERIAKNANPLALVATTSPYPDPFYQAPKSHKPFPPSSKQASSTRSNASTKFKGKEIAKPITPPSEYKNDNQTGQFRNQRTITVVRARETVSSQIQKKLKKANASLAHELKECKSILTDCSRTLGESNSIRDSCLILLQNKLTEFERYKALNDRTVDYDKLERKLNETLGLLAQKEIDIKESLKVKAYEMSVVKEKHDDLVKQNLLTKSHYEGLVKEKTK